VVESPTDHSGPLARPLAILLDAEAEQHRVLVVTALKSQPLGAPEACATGRAPLRRDR
jgi:hypothetical protein